jgi:hypothetical protein
MDRKRVLLIFTSGALKHIDGYADSSSLRHYPQRMGVHPRTRSLCSIQSGLRRVFGPV